MNTKSQNPTEHAKKFVSEYYADIPMILKIGLNDEFIKNLMERAYMEGAVYGAELIASKTIFKEDNK